jgi:hypothetical protein
MRFGTFVISQSSVIDIIFGIHACVVAILAKDFRMDLLNVIMIDWQNFSKSYRSCDLVTAIIFILTSRFYIVDHHAFNVGSYSRPLTLPTWMFNFLQAANEVLCSIGGLFCCSHAELLLAELFHSFI